ncbi:hypothetical protein VP01_84g8 [Puccinia sorghi]|uniref:DDE Tnp4 domain-containing protein n=1 Tax=Puccinia sorghi TaxID=27349 RepID=A0A0L6U963_9BASI|nr:hypothetical protein VP01_84g8 [Puccinia sorghi]
MAKILHHLGTLCHYNQQKRKVTPFCTVPREVANISYGVLSPKKSLKTMQVIVEEQMNSSELGKGLWKFIPTTVLWQELLFKINFSLGQRLNDVRKFQMNLKIKGLKAVLVTLLACDNNKKIQYVSTGWPGCSHYQWHMKNCGLNQSPSDLFTSGQYLVADYTVLVTVNTVPAFKREKKKDLIEKQHDFNRHLSGFQVIIQIFIALLNN